MTMGQPGTLLERLSALDAAAEAGDGTGVILAALEDEAPAVRERALRYAARHVEPGTLVAFVADHERASLRSAAIGALEWQGPYAVPHLERLLAATTDEGLLMFVLQILGRIGTAATVAAMLPFIGHQNPHVAQSAMEAVGRLGARAAVPALLAQLPAERGRQLSAIEALGAIGDRLAVEPLLALVPDAPLAGPAARALARFAPASALGPLATRAAAPVLRDVRAAVIEALAAVIERAPADGRLGPPLAAFAVAVAGDEAVARDLTHWLTDSEQVPRAVADAAAIVTIAARLEERWPAALAQAAAGGALDRIATLVRTHAGELGAGFTPLVAHADRTVRRAALLVGAFDGSARAALLTALADADPEVRAAACRALGTLRDGTVAAALVDRLERGAPAERTAAAAALGELPRGALGLLMPLLRQRDDDELLIYALDALERAGGDLAQGDILELAQHPAPGVRRAALRVAAGVEGMRAEQVLLRALADADETVQTEALDVLIRREGGQAQSKLVALLSVADSLRFRVIRALGRLRARGAASKLLALYPECAPHEQLEVIGALSRIAPAGIRGFLHQRMDEGDLDILRAAVRGLALIAETEDLPRLRELAVHRDWNVRAAAARALGRLPADATRPLLLELARDVEALVASIARDALAASAEPG